MIFSSLSLPLRKGESTEADECEAKTSTVGTLDVLPSGWESSNGSGTDDSWSISDDLRDCSETQSEAGSDSSWGTVDALADDWDADSEASFTGDPDTLIFVDADGVINVGINDGSGQAPLLICQDNLDRCKPCSSPPPVGSRKAMSHIMYEAACRQVGYDDDDTYAKFAAPGSSHISPLLVQRLAEILRHAGPHAKLVLSSSWRQSHHLKRVEALEAALSEYSGKTITFDAHTKSGSDHPTKRLEIIGDFVHEYSMNEQPSYRPLRVLVLDDFCASRPFSIELVEEYLRERSLQPQNTSVKIVHCYDKWTSSFGQSVEIGSGLTLAKMSEAESFLASRRCFRFSV